MGLKVQDLGCTGFRIVGSLAPKLATARLTMYARWSRTHRGICLSVVTATVREGKASHRTLLLVSGLSGGSPLALWPPPARGGIPGPWAPKAWRGFGCFGPFSGILVPFRGFLNRLPGASQGPPPKNLFFFPSKPPQPFRA